MRWKLGRFDIFKRLAQPVDDVLVHRLKSSFVEIEGRKMFLDSEDVLELSIYGIHEPHLTQLVAEEINEGDIVIDIGAHVGYYTLLFSSLVGDKGTVFAFESDPDNFALLRKNVAANCCENVILIQACVAEKAGKLRTLRWKDAGTGQGYKPNDSETLSHNPNTLHDPNTLIEIETIRLDDFFTEGKGIDFVKMDIDGAEFGALEGGMNMLNEARKILTEFYPRGLKAFGVSPEKYLELFVNSGFDLYEVKKDSTRCYFPPSKLREHIPTAHRHSDIFCLKR